MIIFAIIGWILAVIMTVAAIRFGLIILDVENRTELSLDELDKHYRTLTAILELPLASNDQYAHRVVGAVKAASDAILSIANVLVGQRDRKRDEQEKAGRQ